MAITLISPGLDPSNIQPGNGGNWTSLTKLDGVVPAVQLIGALWAGLARWRSCGV